MRASVSCAAMAMMLALSSCGEDDDSGSSSGGAAGGGSGGVAGSSGSATGGTAGSGGSATGGAAGSGGGSGGQGGTGGQVGSGGQTGGGGQAGSGGVAGTSGSGGQGGASGFALTSGAFTEGAMIPQKYLCPTGGGQGVSPPLAWTAGPTGTQSYAIVMRDLDFQNGFRHWVIWDIPGTLRALPENVQQVYQPSDPAGAKQAPFNGSVTGYFGPCSPNSVNTYEFTIYAIPMATLAGLSQSSTNVQASAAIVAAALASAKLAGES